MIGSHLRARWLVLPALPLLAMSLSAGAQAPVANLPVKVYAQELVDRTAANHPELKVIALHVAPAKGVPNVVIASNIGRIGKPGDDDDLRVIDTGEPRVRRAQDGRRVDIELPLLDAAGLTIGAVSLIWNPTPSDATSDLQRQAEAIRDGLSHRILSAANLVEPYPYVPSATYATRAQKLVEAALQRHPEVRVLALRGRDRATGDLVVLGSSFGRHGKKADGDDMKVLASTSPTTGVYSNGKRFGVDLALHDTAGAPLGTMNVGYAYRQGDDPAPLLAEAIALRDELQNTGLESPALDTLDP
jgi:hypothetical protein